MTPDQTGTFTYAYTATAEGADPVTGEIGFAVEDCEEVAIDATVVDERDEVDEVDEREVTVSQPTTPRVVAGVGGDTEVRGVQQTAGAAATAQLPVTGAATVPLLVVFGLLNLLFGVRLRRYGLQAR